MSDAFDAVVIGAGANGLAAAATLARGRRRTLLLERSDTVGGLAASIEFAPGYSAPPLALDSAWVPPVVARGLGIAMPATVPADTTISVAIDAGRFLMLPADPARAADMLRPLSPRDAGNWPAFAARLRRIVSFLEHVYQAAPPDIDATGFSEMARLGQLGWRLRRLGPGGMTDLLRILPMSVEELLEDEFDSPSLKAAVATGGVQGIRQGPRSGGTAFVLLHHLAGATAGAVRCRGWWREGPDALVNALTATARNAGVTIRTGVEVATIMVRDDGVAGVVLANGDEITARTVLSSADPARTIGMIDPAWLDPEFTEAVRHIKFRGATSHVLYAVDDLPVLRGVTDPGRALVSVLSLSPTIQALERAADAGKYGRVPAQPHVEITAPSLRWPDLAPTGKHVIVARAACTPHTLRNGAAADGGWDDTARSALADAVTDAITCHAPGFADRVLHRAVLTPRDIERRFGCTEGAFTHGEMMLDQILFMRPVPGAGRYAMPIAGLFLCGAGAHPGPGIPGGPGWLGARHALAGGRTT